MGDMSTFDKFETVPMTARRRDLYLRIVDNRSDVHPITLRLHFLENHFPYEKLDGALFWLVRNNYVGSKFIMWFRTECHSSDLEMHAKLLQIVNNEALAPVVAGKNFRT